MTIDDIPTLRKHYTSHVRGDVFARHLKDWHNAERHQQSARHVVAQVVDIIGADDAEGIITIWRDDAIAQAHRELPLLDAQLAEEIN